VVRRSTLCRSSRGAPLPLDEGARKNGGFATGPIVQPRNCADSPADDKMVVSGVIKLRLARERFQVGAEY
jgi:hypothetical protein